MSVPLDKPAPEDAPPKAKISAKAVATALSSAALCCLLAGVAAIHLLGRISGGARLETNPEPVAEAPVVPPTRPTVLPRMTPQEQSQGVLSGYPSLFPSAPVNAAQGVAPRPKSAGLETPTNPQNQRY